MLGGCAVKKNKLNNPNHSTERFGLFSIHAEYVKSDEYLNLMKFFNPLNFDVKSFLLIQFRTLKGFNIHNTGWNPVLCTNLRITFGMCFWLKTMTKDFASNKSPSNVKTFSLV
jgi:hypothetical protein